MDLDFLSSLGQFDIVYSWGVLHHTGNMWQALQNVIPSVAMQGRLFIALYNDQGVVSTVWKGIKKRYNRGLVWRLLLTPIFAAYFALRGLFKDVFFLHRSPFIRFQEYKQSRGMAYTTDLLDWLGGYPFEVAGPDAVFDFFRKNGFELVKLKTAGTGLGNNEFVFVRCTRQTGETVMAAVAVDHNPTGVSDRSDKPDTVLAICLLIVGMYFPTSIQGDISKPLLGAFYCVTLLVLALIMKR